MVRGEKNFEFRVDDRGFAVGDALILWEWQPNHIGGSRTDHDPILRIVTYVLHGTRFGVPEGFVVMSLREPTEQEAEVTWSQEGDVKTCKSCKQQMNWAPSGHYCANVKCHEFHD